MGLAFAFALPVLSREDDLYGGLDFNGLSGEFVRLVAPTRDSILGRCGEGWPWRGEDVDVMHFAVGTDGGLKNDDTRFSDRVWVGGTDGIFLMD